MNMKTLTSAFAALAIFAFSANAQTPARCQQPNCPNTPTECPQAKCPGQKGNCDAQQCPQARYMQGITLTDAQKKKIQELNTQVYQNRQAARVAMKQQKKRANAAADSVKRASRMEYLHQMKTILTPDQYVTYLENIAMSKSIDKPGRPSAMQRGNAPQRGPRHHAMQQNGRKGQRPQGVNQSRRVNAKATQNQNDAATVTEATK